MRAALAVLVVAVTPVAAACAGDGRPPVTTAAPTTAASTTTTTTAVPGSTAARTTVNTTAATTVPPATTAADALAPLRAELERLRLDALDVLTSVEQGPVEAGLPEPPPDLDRRGAALADRFRALTRLVPAGLDPSVRTAAVTAVFALGRLLAPFLRATGWRPSEWSTVWKPIVDDGRASAARTASALDNAARSRPRLTGLDPRGPDAAAQSALVQVLAARAFGGGEFTTAPKAALTWVGSLPATSGAPDCYAAALAQIPGTGGFEPGRGGCAVVVTGTDDASTRARDISAFVADPTAPVPGSRLDLATVWWADGQWTATSGVAAG